MSQSINKIHSLNLIQPSNDEDIFVYDGEYWKKQDISLYKYSDVNVSNIDTSEMEKNDIIALYKSQTNHILYSENFNAVRQYDRRYADKLTSVQKLYWVTEHISFSEKDKVQLPNLSQPTDLMYTRNEMVNGKQNLDKVEHSISQYVYNKHNRKIAFSCYVKKPSDTATDRVALTIFSNAYNIGITSTYNLSDGTCQSPIIMDKNRNEVSSSLIEDTEAGIEYLEKSDCYRIYIIGKIKVHTQFKCQFNILNKNGEFKYVSTNSTEKYSLYVSGFQLEEMSDNTKPTEYMTTLNKPITKKMLHSLYNVYNLSEPRKSSTIRYFNSIRTYYDNDGYIKIESSDPQYTNNKLGDIGLVASILSFANDKIEENKIIIKERNTNKETYDDISEEKQIEMLSDGVVKLGSLENVSKDNNYPLYSIYYDKDKKEYRFKLKNGFATLDYSTVKKVYKSITRALTYNQGYFETWSSKGKCSFKHGFNTGGGYNFGKINQYRR